MSPGPTEIRFKDDSKKLPLLSRLFEWLEAKQSGLGRQIVLKENEVDNRNAWKARLIGDNDDIAAQFPRDMRMPRAREWKSIRPDRWGDPEAVEAVYNRLQKNYRQNCAQLKRNDGSVPRVEDKAARGVDAGSTSKLLHAAVSRTEGENSGPLQQEHPSVPHNVGQNGQSVFKAGNTFVVSKESLLIQVANLQKQNTELQAAVAAAREGQAALHIQASRLQIKNTALETQVASHQEECAAVQRASADARVAFERAELDKQRSALQVAKEAIAAQVAADRLQHQQDYAALRGEKEAGDALVASVLAKCADLQTRYTALQTEKETLQVQVNSDRLQLAELRVRYDALRAASASRLIQELPRDEERVQSRTASEQEEHDAVQIEKESVNTKITRNDVEETSSEDESDIEEVRALLLCGRAMSP